MGQHSNKKSQRSYQPHWLLKLNPNKQTPFGRHHPLSLHVGFPTRGAEETG